MKTPPFLTLLVGLSSTLVAAELDPRIAVDGAFPDASGSRYFAGEITLVEHVNRRGILRLDRDGTINKYHWDLPHHFQMLPYGTLRLRGAPAAMSHLPIGLHLHGEFYLGPDGDYEVKPPPSGYVAGKSPRPDLRSVVSRYEKVFLLEDGFSFHVRQGVGWKILAVDEARATLTAETVEVATGKSKAEDSTFSGMKGEQVFRIDRGTTVWKGNGFGQLEDLEVGQVVQLNLGRVTLLGETSEDGLCREIWIDAESQRIATGHQRQKQIAFLKRRGIPAMVTKTESLPGEGAKGYVTVQPYAGVDEELLAAFVEGQGLRIRVAEPTLRTYDVNDIKSAGSLEITRLENPPAGSSGVEFRMLAPEMLEGFRPGRTVRLIASDWSPPMRPLEERLWPNDTRIFEVGPKHITDRDGPPLTD